MYLAVWRRGDGLKSRPVIGERPEALVHILQLPLQVHHHLLVLLRSAQITVHVFQDVLDAFVHLLKERECVLCFYRFRAMGRDWLLP